MALAYASEELRGDAEVLAAAVWKPRGWSESRVPMGTPKSAGLPSFPLLQLAIWAHPTFLGTPGLTLRDFDTCLALSPEH